MTIKGWEKYSAVEAEETPVSHLVIESFTKTNGTYDK